MIPSRNANSATARSLPPCALMADGTSRRSTTQKCAYAAAMTTLDLRRAAGAARCFCSARCEDDEHPARGTRDSGGPSRRERRRAVLQLQQLWNADAADDADEADPLGVARQQSPNEPGRSSPERPRAGFGKSSQLEVFSKTHLLSRAPRGLGRRWSARPWRLRVFYEKGSVVKGRRGGPWWSLLVPPSWSPRVHSSIRTLDSSAVAPGASWCPMPRPVWPCQLRGALGGARRESQ